MGPMLPGMPGLDWDRANRERKATKDVAAGEPASWKPLPPLDAEEPLVLERKTTPARKRAVPKHKAKFVTGRTTVYRKGKGAKKVAKKSKGLTRKVNAAVAAVAGTGALDGSKRLTKEEKARILARLAFKKPPKRAR